MTITVNIHEAKTTLSQLLLRVSAGEEVIIAKAGKPVARFVSITERPARRVLGNAKGQVLIMPDFDAPLPDNLGAAFEG